jgi:hypothetical protein
MAKALKVKTEVVVTDGAINENLANVYYQEVSARTSMIRDNLRFHRERGRVISRVKEGKSLDGKTDVDYGPNPVEVLSDKLGVSRSYAYKLATFYKLYENIDTFQDLLDKFEDYQFTLSWSHFNCLVHVKDAELRQELIEEALKDKLSVRALHNRLTDKNIKVDDDEFVEEGIDDGLVTQTVPTVPVVLASELEEPEPREPAEESHDSSDDSPVTTGNPVKILKNLVTVAAKFGDKLVDLVGDLTISLNEVDGSRAHRDVFKGLSSSKEVLHSLKQQLNEYHTQLDNIETRLLSQRREDKDD